MRAMKFALASLCVIGFAGAANAEPIKIRNSWVAPVSNWASILLDKKDLAKHLGQSYVMEPVRFAGTPPMITALANDELEIANLAYSTLGIAIENAGLSDLRVIADEFQDGVAGYYSQEYMVLEDSADPEGRGPQGQGGRHQCRRQRSRRRHEGDAAQARPRAQPRLHRHRGAVPGHEGDAGRAKGRSSFRPWCRSPTIPNCATWRATCSCRKTRSASPT